MKYTPQELVDFVREEGLEFDFLQALMQHVQGYTIGEVVDQEIKEEEEQCRLASASYGLDIEITDPEIIGAIRAKRYVSAFLSRYNEVYQVHFLIHPYRRDQKEKYEEEITKEVVRYMMIQTILTLQLDTKGKVKKYCGI